MEPKKGYKLGILGGMGPAATANLYQRIVEKEVANCDQEHLEMVILNKASIPDRTRALLYKETSPIDKLNEGIRELINNNCEYFIMPCNTAHAYKDEFKNLDKIKFISMIDTTIEKLEKTKKDYYVLCTNGTRLVDVYKAPFLKYPNMELQDRIMDIVTNIKAGMDQYQELLKIIKLLDGNILLACTELSIYYERFLKDKELNKYLIEDSMEILIDNVLKLCQ